MIMAKLSSQIKTLLPFDSIMKVDELIVLLKQRNTVVDTQMYYRICGYIGNSQLEKYFLNSIDGLYIKIKEESYVQEPISVSPLVDSFKPLDSIAKVNSLIDAIKKTGGVISAEDKINVYLKIWDPSLKSYWAAKCQRELRITYLSPKQEKTSIKKKKNKNKPHSFGNPVERKKRTHGIIDPNSSDYNNQVLKETLKSRYADYEYGLSDW